MFSAFVAFLDKLTTKKTRRRDDVAFNVAADFLVSGPLPVPGLCTLVQSYGAGLQGQCIKILRGHTAEITALTPLLGGKLASGSRDKTVRIWVDTLCVRTLTGHTAGITSLAVLLNGYLASGSLDTTVRFWDTNTGSCLSVMDVHRSPVYALATLLDGRLISGGVDTFRCISNVEAKHVSVCNGSQKCLFAIALFPNGDIATSLGNGTIKVWGGRPYTLSGFADSVRALTVLPDNKIASGSLDKTIIVWKDGRPIYHCRGDFGAVHALCVCNGMLVSGTQDATVSVWDDDGSRLLAMTGHTKDVTALTLIPGGTLASGSKDCTIRLWR
jgi:WD40 repeat protein